MEEDLDQINFLLEKKTPKTCQKSDSPPPREKIIWDYQIFSATLLVQLLRHHHREMVPKATPLQGKTTPDLQKPVEMRI